MEQPVMAVAEEEYRTAFHVFSEQVRKVQYLTSQPDVSQASLDAAMKELKRVHRIYNERRDDFAQFMLQPMALTAGSC